MLVGVQTNKIWDLSVSIRLLLMISMVIYTQLRPTPTTTLRQFVHNCNKSYKETMKTVAFAVKMGMRLSHVGSASLRRMTRVEEFCVRYFHLLLTFAKEYTVMLLMLGICVAVPNENQNENFAREAMQLETVGLDN